MGWELWFNYGVWAGVPVDKRRPEPLNTIMPKHINWLLNSLDDGSICMGAILLIYLGKFISETDMNSSISNFSEKGKPGKVPLVRSGNNIRLVFIPKYFG